MNIFLLFIDFFRNYHTQLIIAELMFCIFLKPRLKYYQIVLIISTYLAIPMIFKEIYFWEIFRIGNWFTLGFIVMLLLSIIVIWVCFEISNIKELLFYIIAAIVVQHVVYALGRIVRFVFHIESSLTYQIVIVIVFTIIYPLFYFVFVKRLIKDNFASMRKGVIIAFTLFSTFFVYILGLWTSANEPITLGALAFDAFCCVLLLLLHFGMFEWSKLERENEIMNHLMHVDEEKQAMSAESIELVNMKYHDLKYQISLLKHMTEKDKQKECIEEIEHIITTYDKSINTNNETLDILLSERKWFWEKHNINFTCIADGAKLNFMLPFDIYSLFGNALDNAIESVKMIKDEERRVVSLNVFLKGNYIIINIANYFGHELAFENGLPITTKPNNTYHGYGMKSIKYLTDKYGGTMSIITDKKIFKLNILIPIKEVK